MAPSLRAPKETGALIGSGGGRRGPSWTRHPLTSPVVNGKTYPGSGLFALGATVSVSMYEGGRRAQ